jgi:hypothetical protein
VARGQRPVELVAELTLHSYLDTRWSRRLIRYPPARRNRELDEWYRRAFERLVRRWPSDRVEAIGGSRAPRSVRSTVAARDLPKVLSLPDVQYVWIESIPGIRKKRRPREKQLVAVEVRLVFQLEGQTRGLQRYEDRVVVVEAFSERQAERQVRRTLRDLEEPPYLNRDGTMARWHLERTLNVWTAFSKFDPEGTEVYYRFRDRRMKPEYEWHPLRRPRPRRRKPG